MYKGLQTLVFAYCRRSEREHDSQPMNEDQSVKATLLPSSCFTMNNVMLTTQMLQGKMARWETRRMAVAV